MTRADKIKEHFKVHNLSYIEYDENGRWIYHLSGINNDLFERSFDLKGKDIFYFHYWKDECECYFMNIIICK